ncbi:hypothetical protein Tco_0992407 [Tanacetum coccineum]|uniref:Uncharacterized protein n=1 Tax=Tanacetum coccineum TaxID=301880 RepID=A0ABQ5F2Q0_9ASTR
MAPKRSTRSNTAPETTNTTYVTDAQLQAMTDQGVTAALAARYADRNTNGDDSHNSGTGVKRNKNGLTSGGITSLTFSKMSTIKLQRHGRSCRNGYLRKGRKTKPKRQNRTRNGKAWKRQSQDKAQV